MAITLTALNNYLGEWNSILKKFVTVLDLTLLDIPFTQDANSDIKLLADAPMVINFNGIVNASAIIIYSDKPITVSLDGGPDQVCDPLLVVTNQAAAAVYGSLTLTRSAGIDTNVSVAIYA
jgi:hypothetical protein